MKKFAFLLIILALSSAIYGSSNTEKLKAQLAYPREDIKSLFKEEQYQQIINIYAPQASSLSAEELMYVAESYMYLGDSQNGLKLAELAFQKDKQDSRIYFVTGVLYNNEGEYNKAINKLEEAIKRSPKESNYYAALGDSYFGLEDYDKALLNYKKATNLNPPAEKAYFMIASIYANQNKEKEALDAFYTAEKRITKDKEMYVTTLYNIGKIEFDNKAFDKAAKTYSELLTYLPDDFYSSEKLIQCYNILGEYDKANNEKASLYKAYSDSKLMGSSISNEFCFDQFVVDSKEVIAYERYQSKSEKAFVKYTFYVINGDGNIEYSLTLEDTPSSDNKRILVVAKNMGNERSKYNIEFSNTVGYSTIKPYIIDIISGKIKPQ